MEKISKIYFTIIVIVLSPFLLSGQTLSLGTIGGFALFTSNGALSNTGVSNVTGDIGSDIGAVSGFGGPSVLIGNSYNSDAVTAQAKTDLFIAYNQLISIPVTNTTHTPAFGGGETLTTGVYAIAGAGSLGGTLTLDGLGDADAVFIFRFGGAYAVGASSTVVLTNGARTCNIFWVAEGAISLGENTIMKGSLLANNAAVSAAAGCDIDGRMLSTTGALAFGPAVISIPTCNSNITLPVSPPCCNPYFGTTIDFVIFTSNGAISNTGSSNLTKNLGTNLGGYTGMVPATVVGTLYDADAVTAQAKTDLFSLYNQLTINPVNYSHGAVFGSGEILTSGVYYVNQAASLAGDLILDGQNDTNSVFIFKIRGAFAAAAASNMILANLASPCSVFWVVEGAISIGSGSTMKGTYLANNAAVSMQSGGDLEGRLFSTTGAIDFHTLNADNTAPCHHPTSMAALPVELLSFEAICKNQNISVEWSVASELNNDYYAIEKSIDGLDWGTITKTTSVGNSNTINHYSIIDSDNMSEMSYYRLKQIDFDGGYSHSSIIVVKNCEEDFTELNISPNPVNKFLNISINFPEERINSISIYNQFGSLVSFSERHQPFIELEDKSDGIYILKVELETKIIIKKFVVNN